MLFLKLVPKYPIPVVVITRVRRSCVFQAAVMPSRVLVSHIVMITDTCKHPHKLWLILSNVFYIFNILSFKIPRKKASFLICMPSGIVGGMF